ncbi:hypothetical protein FS749_001852, partial [Ceratobasidium sp. UAMH 11750]
MPRATLLPTITRCFTSVATQYVVAPAPRSAPRPPSVQYPALNVPTRVLPSPSLAMSAYPNPAPSGASANSPFRSPRPTRPHDQHLLTDAELQFITPAYQT